MTTTLERLARLEQTCDAIDGEWIQRRRKLTTWKLVSFLMAALPQRASLSTTLAIDALGAQKWPFSDAALSRARARAPPDLFERLFRNVTAERT